MDRGIIIVNLDGDIYEKDMDVSNVDSDNHVTYLRKYLKEKEYDFDGIDEMTTYNLCIYSIQMGLMILQIDKEMVVAYLPQKLSNYQYDWYKNNKKRIKKVRNLAIVDIDEDNDLNLYDRSNLDGDNPFKKYRELMEEKAIYEVKDEENENVSGYGNK